jgi:hypothetical protein
LARSSYVASPSLDAVQPASRRDDPQLTSYLRIEERELEAGGVGIGECGQDLSGRFGTGFGHALRPSVVFFDNQRGIF